MTRCVAIVHTSFVSVEPFALLFAELGPDVTLRHVVDADVLVTVRRVGGVDGSVEERMRTHYHAAARSGCDAILNTCSSVGEVADRLAGELDVPVVKVDEAMAERACALGARVGVVATLATTLGPTVRLVEAAAARLGDPVSVTSQLVEQAFPALERGARDEHDRLLRDAIGRLADTVDVVVCAQGSMAPLAEGLPPLAVPVLTSPRLGVERTLAVLGGAPANA